MKFEFSECPLSWMQDTEAAMNTHRYYIEDDMIHKTTLYGYIMRKNPTYNLRGLRHKLYQYKQVETFTVVADGIPEGIYSVEQEAREEMVREFNYEDRFQIIEGVAYASYEIDNLLNWYGIRLYRSERMAKADNYIRTYDHLADHGKLAGLFDNYDECLSALENLPF